jgi:predicted phosphodiesterase
MLRLGVVTDIHWCPDVERDDHWHDKLDFAGVPDRLRDALSYCGESGVDAIVLLGDLAHDGDEESLDAVRSTCAEHWAGPTFFVAGNHDLVDELPDVGEIRLDFPVTKLPGGELPPHGPLLLLSHDPVLSQEELFAARGFKYAGRLDGADGVAAQLQDRVAPTVVFCGHVHARASCADGDVLQLAFGALIEPPFECAIVEIEPAPERLSIRRRSCRLGAQGEGSEPVFAPGDELWEFAGRGWVSRPRAGVELFA